MKVHQRDGAKFWSQLSWYESTVLCLTSWVFVWVLHLVVDILLVLLREGYEQQSVLS